MVVYIDKNYNLVNLKINIISVILNENYILKYPFINQNMQVIINLLFAARIF